MDNTFSYMPGFGNEFSSEALPNALPSHNSPQHPPYQLYTEQLNGTAFTVPRKSNQKW
jgi:homogentisate 1,2-dioxygenase